MNSKARRALFFFCSFFALFDAESLRAEFLCAGVDPATPRAAKASITAAGTFSALVIFAKFKGEAPGDEMAPPWAGDLFNPDLPGSFTNFYNNMSRGQLRMEGRSLPRRYTSLRPASAYVAAAPGRMGRFGEFDLEILEQADADVDMGLFDNDGPDGVPNSGDDDGYVDVVFIHLLTVPRDFFVGTATGFASLGLDTDFISDDPAAGGGFVRIRSRFSGFGGTTQRGQTFSVAASTMCHEFGHVLGLPDLFDQSRVTATGEVDPAADGAGIGKWGVMGLGTLGWGVEDGPNAFCAWSLEQLGWLGRDNENLVEVDQSMRGVVIEQIDAGGEVYKIPLSPDEYFLLENRQNSASYYNRNIPQGGLLLWHVDLRADNDEERHKQVDLVCADGLFADRGFPGTMPDPVAGGDNLDFFARDQAYAAAHNGNDGDATDPFDGVRFTRFAADTNPGASAHAGFKRNLPLGIVLDRIRADGERMVLDILLRQPLDGHISSDTTWSGEVRLAGDIIVEPGATLTLASGTTVLFAAGDSRRSGFDAQRSELIVYGGLVLQGSAGTLRFAAAPQARQVGAWGGIFLMSGQNTSLEGATVEDALYGVVRSRLPAGSTRVEGNLLVPWDLLVPAGAELVVAPGALLSFAADDLGRRGRFPLFSELVVEGNLRVEGTAVQPARMTVNSTDPNQLWFGMQLGEEAQADIRFLQVDHSGVGLGGSVGERGSLNIADSRFILVGNGLQLTINGQAEVERTGFTRIGGVPVRAQGSGRLVLRNVEIVGNGREGISLGNCSLEASDIRLEQNGLFDPNDPRSGLLATGGRGQKIALQKSNIERNTLHGLDLSDWEGTLEIRDSQIRANSREGLRAGGLERLVFDAARFENNLGSGAVVAATPLEIRKSSFAGNVGRGLELEEGASGVVDETSFQGNTALGLRDIEDLVVRGSTFENAGIGALSENSTPTLEGNRFSGNLTALQVKGARVPALIRNNVFVENNTAIENLAARVVPAQNNYWGTVDTSAIAALFKGEVEWMPFLSGEPGRTAVEEEETGQPTAFALHGNFPNPFNGQTVIRFDIAARVRTELVLYDILGRPVRRLLARELAPGYYNEVWNGLDQKGRAVASGVYFYRLRAGRFVATGRLALVR